VNGRPILNLSLALNYAVSGTAPWSYHAANLAILVLCALVLFGIVRRTLALRGLPQPVAAALAVALLWEVHPLLTESVTYVVQRAESLMGLFYLLTLYALVRGSQALGRARAAWLGLSVASCLLGMGTKEVMVSAPLVAFLFDRTFLAGTFREAWRRRRGFYLCLAATWVPLAFLVAGSHGRSGSAGFGAAMPAGRYALTQGRAIVHYLRLCFWPHPLVFDYGTALAQVSPLSLACAGAVVVLLAGTMWALVRRPVAGFLGAAFFAILAPSSSFVPVVTETMAEHRMFLSLIPVVVVVVAGGFRWSGRAAPAIFAVIGACLLAATWTRNQDYRTVVGIWTTAVEACPDNDRAHDNLGSALRGEPGRLGDAEEQFKEAIRLNPDSPESHYNLGVCLDQTPGGANDAIDQYEEAVHLNPRHANAQYNLACDLSAFPRRIDEAIAHFDAALQADPDNANAHFNLGNALVTVHRLPEALSQYQEAVRLEPGFAQARFNLGNALLSSGKPDDAIPEYRKAVELQPNVAEYHFNLAQALLRIPGREREAADALNIVLKLQPENDEARQLLKQLRQLRGDRLIDSSG
jgi:tetratricopeptide (TPR) repeat protein